MNFLKVPLGRFLIDNNIVSQRSAKSFVKSNEILVNDIKVDDALFLIDSKNDTVSVNKKILPHTEHVYYAFNKPLGTVCSTVSDSHKTVYDFVKEKNLPLTLRCAGRLDCDTEGLLIFSSNGTFINALTRPENNIKKTYLVTLERAVSSQEADEYVRKVKAGVKIPAEKKSPGFTSRSAELVFINSTCCKITVTEGKFHEVRRIFLALKNRVAALKRISFFEFELGDLPSGEFCKLCL